MSGFRINPSAADLFTQNAVVSGRNSRYHVEPIEGTLSIKTMLAGSGVWATPQGRYEVTPETCLILNEGQTYTLEIDAPSPAHTFCVFLRPGFLEHSFGFYERLQLTPQEIKTPLAKLKLLADEGSIDGLEADEAMHEIAIKLIESESAPKEAARLEHAKASARDEVFRQLNRSRDFALSNLAQKLSLDELAAIACMSPFHFHRLHRQAFRETPHEFVTRARLYKAMRLLKGGQEVGDVSIALGFESVPTFTRLFKTRIGTTPGLFARLNNRDMPRDGLQSRHG